jgi:hypothetical protein
VAAVTGIVKCGLEYAGSHLTAHRKASSGRRRARST